MFLTFFQEQQIRIINSFDPTNIFCSDISRTRPLINCCIMEGLSNKENGTCNKRLTKAWLEDKPVSSSFRNSSIFFAKSEDQLVRNDLEVNQKTLTIIIKFYLNIADFAKQLG